jgi:hypothetical protein
MKKAIICAFGLAVLATPAFAVDYWVVRDSLTKRCAVVTEETLRALPGFPLFGAMTTTTIIGNTGEVVVIGDKPENTIKDRAFKTRKEAEDLMKTTKVCSSD